MSKGNRLFPVFFKLENLRLTIIGGGAVATEKLTGVLANSPETRIKMVATWFCDDVKKMAQQAASVCLIEKAYDTDDLAETDLLIIGVNDKTLSEQICADAKTKGILCNAADKPDLCDFYLASVVQKGDIKIAISTNGKSPTLAKRLREFFTDVLPDELDGLADNLHQLRGKMKDDFEAKVRRMNELTKDLLK